MNANALVKNQRDNFNSNKTKPIAFRIGQLKLFLSTLKKNEARLCEAIHTDYKKSAFDSFMLEFLTLYEDLEMAIRRLPRWSRPKKVGTNLLNWPAKSYILPEPLGVTLVIGAWNYPIQLSLAPVVGALAAGNTVILKPSELCSATSHALERMINETFDPDYFAVVEGEIPETTALLNAKFDKIFFTGSTSVSKIVYQAAAKNLTPVTLELGGKSPVIITADSDLDISVKRLIWAKFINAGQTCIAPDYVLVHKSLEKAFLEKAKAEILAADYSVLNRNYVQISNERNTSRIVGLIDQEKVYFGGQSNLESRYIAPTLMSDVTFEDKIMSEEIFGPILPVISYTELDPVIATIKERPKPLSLYLFTKNEQTKKKILREISFGGGCVNDAVMHFSNDSLPFGGVGESGMGNYHGEAGFRTFSHYKSILEKPTWIEPNLKYYPRPWLKRTLLKLVVACVRLFPR
jgi:aldehyde dehydrogenase (NAD+)